MVFTPPEATNTGRGFNLGSGGGARGCGFEERVGAYARTEGAIFFSPRCLRVCLWPLKLQFRSVGLRNNFDNCGVGSSTYSTDAPGGKKKPPPYLSAARQEPSPNSGHLTSSWAILSTRTRKFGPERNL